MNIPIRIKIMMWESTKPSPLAKEAYELWLKLGMELVKEGLTESRIHEEKETKCSERR